MEKIQVSSARSHGSGCVYPTVWIHYHKLECVSPVFNVACLIWLHIYVVCLSLRGWLLQYWPPVCAQKDRAQRVLLAASRGALMAMSPPSYSTYRIHQNESQGVYWRSQIGREINWSAVRFLSASCAGNADDQTLNKRSFSSHTLIKHSKINDQLFNTVCLRVSFSSPIPQ